MGLSFLTESTNGFAETQTIGSFSAGMAKNSFDAIFENAHAAMLASDIDPMVDINTLIKNDVMMESFKDAVLSQLQDDCAAYGDDSRYGSLYEQVSAMWDNCVDDFIKESTRVGQLLPFKAMDLPVLVKQHLKIASKDIIQTEVTKSPIIKKHVERTYIVDTKTNKRWEYPTCFFTEDFTEIYNAGKGLAIEDTPVELPLFQYDIITELTDGGNPARDRLSTNLKIVKLIDEENSEYPVDMRINLADGSWLGGAIDTVTPSGTSAPGTPVKDLVSGMVDFTTNTITLSAANDKIKKVVFSGYLSNELNERSVSMEYAREEFEWKIEDGFRMNIPYSLEELEDAKALLNIDLYKKTYDNLADILAQMEDSNILKYLDDEFTKYDGIEVDPLQFTSFIRKGQFDCDHTATSGILQSQYIEEMLKFQIDRFIIDIADTAKMEDMTFVIYGNPRYISLLGEKVNWVVRSGDMVGGIKANYSYGVMNSGGVKIQVVSTNKVDSKRYRALRIIPYPLNEEQMTFKHYKYTTHILTTANSGYKAADRPGGSATNLMGTTRCVTVSVQGIQGEMSFTNDDFILKA